ncbi:MAG: alpha/beta hydrolase [Muricauda sp.]|nr:alpha/beta hydrolase [Allomuricauda sp.]
MTVGLVKAQPMANRNMSLPSIDSIQSKYVEGQTYKLHITLPPNYKPNTKTYPVLYYLDAWEYTGIMNTLAKGFMFRGMIEPIILVGISLDTDVDGYLTQRNRDFLPRLDAEDHHSGADHFINFLKEELLPYMEGHYSASDKDRGLFGHSYGGLFTSYTIKREPGLFSKLAIASPSLWYQDFALLTDSGFQENIKGLSHIRILLTYGSLEPEAIKKGADDLFELMVKNEKVQTKRVEFLAENHVSVIAATCSRLLMELYKHQ